MTSVNIVDVKKLGEQSHDLMLINSYSFHHLIIMGYLFFFFFFFPPPWPFRRFIGGFPLYFKLLRIVFRSFFAFLTLPFKFLPTFLDPEWSHISPRVIPWMFHVTFTCRVAQKLFNSGLEHYHYYNHFSRFSSDQKMILVLLVFLAFANAIHSYSFSFSCLA